MITEKSTINDISHFSLLSEIALKHFEILKGDLNDTVEDICVKNNIDKDFFLTILNTINEPEEFNQDAFNEFSAIDIADYLISSHRYYLDKQIPEIEQAIFNLKKDCQEYNPLIELLDVFFAEYKADLVEHINFEEDNLFPYIFNLTADIALGKQKEKKSILSKFIESHDDSAEKKINSLLETLKKKYPQITELMSYSLLERKLLAFEADLSMHAMIEDNVLTKKVADLEKLQMVG